MIEVKVDVKGLKELRAKLAKLKKTTANKCIRKGTRAGCKIVQQQAKADASKKSGALRKAIKVRALPHSRKWVGTKVSLQIPYGSFVELGARKRNIKGRHFLKDAAEQAGERAVKTAMSITAQQIEDEMRK